MNIKKNDNVTVISGTDKGKSGKVIMAMPRENKILVEGINVHKRHTKARKSGDKGQIVDKPFPIHVSNVKKA